MSVRLKLIVIVVFVAIVPLAVSAVTSLWIHREAHDDALAALQRNAARHAAATTDAWLDNTNRNLLSVTNLIPWQTLADVERRGALTLVYGQFDHIALVRLSDAAGQIVDDGVFTAVDEQPGSSHPPLSEAALTELERHAPRPTDDESVTIGDVFADPVTGNPLLPIAVPLRNPDIDWHLSVAVSLAPLCAALAGQDEALHLSLWDRELHQLCPVARADPLLAAPQSLATALEGGARDRFAYRSRRGVALLGSAVPAGNEWTAIAYQPLAHAQRSSLQMRNRTVLWLALSLLAALAAGLYLARGVTLSVRALEAGARALGRGEFDHRIEVSGGDELSLLAGTFNQMSEGLKRRDAEINAWNRELQQRVEQRTRELKEAQGQLLQSRKIAAMSALAAGVAHEINNPLTVVLGMTQILKRRGQRRLDAERAEPDGPGDGRENAEGSVRMLTSIEESARRIRDIIRVLQTLSQEQQGEAFTRVDVNEAVVRALDSTREYAEAQSVSLTAVLSSRTLAVRGNAAQLQQLIRNLVDNAITACSTDGTIEITTGDIDDELVVVTVKDDGAGIAPEHLDRVFEPFFTTKSDWQGRGLGLTVTHQIVENHNGIIRIESKTDSGTSVLVTLPTARDGAHLE